MSADLWKVAAHLSLTDRRFMTDQQIGSIQSKHGVSKDEARTAAILADRIRRHRQIEEQRDGFSVADLVPMDATIELKQKLKPAGKKRLSLRSKYEKVCRLK